MAIKYFGVLQYIKSKNVWELRDVPPHVSIKLKSVFPKIKKESIPPYIMEDTIENCADLKWFTGRFAMKMTSEDSKRLSDGDKNFHKHINDLEVVYSKKYKPRKVVLKSPHKPRNYQLVAKDLAYKAKRILIADEFGLGKTLTSLLVMLEKGTLPAIVVCQTHLQDQWAEQIVKFTNLSYHKIKTTKPYPLPDVDVVIVKYSCLSGWVDVLSSGHFNYAVFDECQELRRSESNKYVAAKNISMQMKYVVFLSATPIYNYGDEIFTVLNCMNKGCLGSYDDFAREWTNYGKVVKDVNALGSYLRDNFLMIRRRREDVGQELPAINKIVYTVDYDQDAVEGELELLSKLAYTVVNSNFYIEKGSAARELDLRMRQITGVSKAKSCAAFISMLVNDGEKVVVGVWHREVYDIMQKYFDKVGIKSAMYSGSESSKQKDESRNAFINEDTDVLLLSLRSGAGMDGLQHVCKYVVIAEFDWSPQVLDQLIARVDRPGNQSMTTAIFLQSEFGSDPLMIDLLGLKKSQSTGIIDPFMAVAEQYKDESRIVMLAKKILETEKPAIQEA